MQGLVKDHQCSKLHCVNLHVTVGCVSSVIECFRCHPLDHAPVSAVQCHIKWPDIVDLDVHSRTNQNISSTQCPVHDLKKKHFDKLKQYQPTEVENPYVSIYWFSHSPASHHSRKPNQAFDNAIYFFSQQTLSNAAIPSTYIISPYLCYSLKGSYSIKTVRPLFQLVGYVPRGNEFRCTNNVPTSWEEL